MRPAHITRQLAAIRIPKTAQRSQILFGRAVFFLENQLFRRSMSRQLSRHVGRQSLAYSPESLMYQGFGHIANAKSGVGYGKSVRSPISQRNMGAQWHGCHRENSKKERQA